MENILHRMKLLMEYDTSKTLSENILITEQASLADDVAKALGVLGKGAGDDLIKASRIVDDAGKTVSTLDDFSKLAKANKIAPTQLGRVQSSLLKNSTLTLAQKETMLNNYVAQAIKKGRGVGKTSTQISDDLVSKGFPKDVADDVGTKLNSHWNANKSGPAAFKPAKVKTTKTGKPKSLKPKKTKNPSPNPADDAAKIEDEIAKSGSKPWPAWLKWGAGLGISAAALWWFFHDSDEVVAVPEDIPEEEPVTDNGGGSGGSGGTGGGGEGGYTDCPGPDYSKGCKSEAVRKVQTCLGLTPDGKFGPKTQSALEGKGYPNGFTDSDIDKICGRVQGSPEPQPQVDLPTPDAEENVDALDV